jgi:hypothetical protein
LAFMYTVITSVGRSHGECWRPWTNYIFCFQDSRSIIFWSVARLLGTNFFVSRSRFTVLCVCFRLIVFIKNVEARVPVPSGSEMDVHNTMSEVSFSRFMSGRETLLKRFLQ